MMQSNSASEKHPGASHDNLDRDQIEQDKSGPSRASSTSIPCTTNSATVTTTINTSQATINSNTSTSTASSGYYSADKCRAYIANQIKVSKIDRFATQVSNAMEVESNIQQRLVDVLNLYIKRCAQITHEFTFRCKSGIQRYRLLSNQRKPSKLKKTDSFISDNTKPISISNDLLHGIGVQMVRTLLTQPILLTKQIKKKLPSNKESTYPFNEDTMKEFDVDRDVDDDKSKSLEKSTFKEEDYLLCEAFEPSLFVKKLDDCIRINLRKSKAIMSQLSTIRQLFERLASEHRDNVDLVYAAEEERQSASVTRRSAYNLSVAAIKATSTPVHVNLNEKNE